MDVGCAVASSPRCDDSAAAARAARRPTRPSSRCRRVLSLKHECAQPRAAEKAEGGAAAAGDGPTEAERSTPRQWRRRRKALAREVTQQHKLHKRAKAGVSRRRSPSGAGGDAAGAQQAAAAAGGGASAETDEEARFREIMKAQNEVVIELREENERLAAKIAVLEAK